MIESDFIKLNIENIKKSKLDNENAISALWYLAKKKKDIDSMAEIAGLEKLPNLVEEEVKKRNEIPIAVAYLIRDGIDIEEKKSRIINENRASVLAGILENSNVTDFEREIIANKLISKPTKALSEVAITDSNIKTSAICVAILQLEARLDSLTDNLRRKIRSQIERCSKEPASATKLALELTNSELADRLLSFQPQIDQDAFNALFERCIIPLLAKGISTSVNNKDIVNSAHIINICNRILGDNRDYFIDDVLLHLKSVITDTEVLAKIWTECVGAIKASEENSIDSEYSKQILEAEVTADTTRIEELSLLADSGTKALIKPLLRNKNLSAERVMHFMNHLDNRDVSKIIELRPFDQDAILYAYKIAFDTLVYSDKYNSFINKEESKRQLLEYLISDWIKTQHSWYSQATNNIMKLIGDIEDKSLIGTLPYSLLYYKNNSFQPINDYLLQHLNQALGNDMKKWETANIISQNFDGSIDDLILAASTL
jgi:hypothetical protein